MKSILTVIGQDRVGIIAGVCTKLAENGINVLDINQTVMHGCFTMMMMVEFDETAMNFVEICNMMEDYGNSADLTIRLQREDIFSAMHRI